mgnify:FL=1
MSSTPEVVYSSAVDSKQNRTSDFDANWKFMLSDSVQAQDPAFDDSAWQQVDLPHDYSITQKYSQSNEPKAHTFPAAPAGTASPSPSTGTSPASASPSTSTACT